MVLLEFFFDFPSGRTGSGVDLPCDINEHQEYFLGGKGGRCIGLTILPLSSSDCLKICEPKPPGILRVCPGLYTDLFTFTFIISLDITNWFTANRSCRTLPSHRTYTHTPKPNKPVDPQLATSQQLQVHETHTKNCWCSTS
jgi:hypothetical protein